MKEEKEDDDDDEIDENYGDSKDSSMDNEECSPKHPHQDPFAKSGEIPSLNEVFLQVKFNFYKHN